jgi:RimJ/RimL family protein N-acetyltransferase
MNFLNAKFILTGWFIIAATLKSHSCDTADTPWEFKTNRTIVRVLCLEDLERAKAVDASDDSFVSITDYIADISFQDMLKKQDETFQESKNINFVRSALNFGTLYYGVFLQGNNVLIGLYRIVILSLNNSLKTDAKFDKKYQGKGYGTEVKRSLFNHYQNLGLIPRHPEDKETTVFQGFVGLISLGNKASLKCAINSGYKIGRLFGDRVDIDYPFVMVSNVTVSDSDFLPLSDEKLHDLIKEPLEKYLSRNSSPDENKKAEETLRQISLKNLMSVRQDLFAMALESESGFIEMTMAKFPYVFKDFEDKLPAIDALISQQEMPCESDFLPHEREMYLAYIETTKQAKENIKQLILEMARDTK